MGRLIYKNQKGINGIKKYWEGDIINIADISMPFDILVIPVWPMGKSNDIQPVTPHGVRFVYGHMGELHTHGA